MLGMLDQQQLLARSAIVTMSRETHQGLGQLNMEGDEKFSGMDAAVNTKACRQSRKLAVMMVLLACIAPRWQH